MSVIIKSNKIANKSFGQSKHLGRSSDDIYADYENRVVQDGGTVKDPAYTKQLIAQLKEINMLGNFNTIVSGKAGVKTATDGGIEKLYAIDGEDMSVVRGSTTPIIPLDVDNNIDFTGNAKTSGGTLFKTNALKFSKTDKYAIGINTSGSEITENCTVASISSLDDLKTESVATIYFAYFDYRTYTGKDVVEGDITDKSIAYSGVRYTIGKIAFMYDASSNTADFYSAGSEVAGELKPTEILSYDDVGDMNITLGGYVNKAKRGYFVGKVALFYTASHLTKEQAAYMSSL